MKNDTSELVKWHQSGGMDRLRWAGVTQK